MRVEVDVTLILDVAESVKVQAIKKARSPQLWAPHFVGGPTLLGGVARVA
jgi:hypothetical protein